MQTVIKNFHENLSEEFKQPIRQIAQILIPIFTQHLAYQTVTKAIINFIQKALPFFGTEILADVQQFIFICA